MPPPKPKAPKPPTSPASKPWDIRPKPSRGSATADDIYRAVGQALTTWEWVEIELATVFTRLVGAREISPPSEPAARAYGAIVGFTSRAAMIGAAADGFFRLSRSEAKDPKVQEFNERLRTELKGLMKSAEGLAQRRNDIAHGVHSGNRLGHFLSPPDYAAKKYPITAARITIWERAAYAYAAPDIEYYNAEFLSLCGRLANFSDVLRSWRRPPRS